MGESLGTRVHEVGNGLPPEVMACCVQSVLVGMHRAGGCVVTCSCCIIMYISFIESLVVVVM